MFSGQIEKPRRTARSNGRSPGSRATTASQSYCNTVPTPDGGTHEAGLRAALTKGLRGYGELTGNKRVAPSDGRRRAGTAAAMLSVFIREPEFQGQTKDKLSSPEAARIVENGRARRLRPLAYRHPAQANRLLDWVVDRAEERLRRKKEKEIGRQTATRACGCRASSPIAR